jgi:formylglycine-generating enzyme required for sulfatase activity
MSRIVSIIVLAICSTWLFCQPALAEKRVALVIGNSAYQRVPVLANPAKDSDDVAEMFRKAGLTVVTAKHDLGAVEMRRTLRDFADEVRDADVAIIYYAGHGMEIEGTNYLIPVDALLERDIDAFDEAIPLDRLMSVMEPAKKLRLVILDACRDNPFSKAMKHSVATRAVERGLARIEPSSPNTLVAFAAKAGSTAADGDDKNSPYTAALLRHLPKPGLDLRKAFGFVRDDVMKVTRNRQEPFIYGSLGGEDVALVPAPQQNIAPPDPNANARDDYDLAQQINVVSAWNAFINKYPSGFYTDLAKAQRDKLIAARTAALEDARLAAEKKVADDAKAEDARIAAEKAKAAEEARVAAQKARAAEDARIAAEKAKAAEEARVAAQKAKAAEEARIAAEKAKAAEEARVAAQKAKAAEEARIAAEKAKAAEEARIAEKARVAEEARIAAEKAKAADEARIAAEKAKAAEEARIAAEKAKAAEEARIAEKAKTAEEARIAEQAKAAEKAAEEAKAAEVARAKAAAQAKAAEPTRLAAAVVGEERIPEQPRFSSVCAGSSAQITALSSRTAGNLSQSEECGLKPTDAFKECENCPEMVMVPAGEVLMGSNIGDIDSGLAAANEGPQHRAVVKQPIAIGRFEVTRDQFAAFVKSTGYEVSERCFTLENNQPQERANRSYLNPGFIQNGDHPAVCISWVDAKAYVQWLAQKTGKPYRLLSEAEFEYVARAGSASRFGVGDNPAELCKFANGADRTAKTAGLPPDVAYLNCSDGFPFTAPVGSFAPNAFGLYDVIGNVWEWTEDCFYGDYLTASADSAARNETACTSRTVRGGDWFSTQASLRPAARAKASVDAHYDDIGFRVARTLAQ